MIFKGSTIIFDKPPIINGSAGVVGRKEGEGPLKDDFDYIFDDTSMGEDSYELAESAIMHNAIIRALNNSNTDIKNVDFLMAGDLLNQCTSSCFAVKDLQIPFIGMYGACSTIALSMANSAMLIDAGANCCVAAASSHFCSCERQFRLPLEYGGQRPPTAQWTVTGAGSAVIKSYGRGVKITACHIGRIVDLGIKDANNMGAAMAPAAAQTISEFLKNTKTQPEDYDLILTGDLGYTGSQLLNEIMKKEYHYDISSVHNDCGLMIYNLEEQDVNSGGSGCGCSASVVCSHIIKEMKRGRYNKVLFVATGALLSSTSAKQKQTIPGIAHAVLLKI